MAFHRRLCRRPGVQGNGMREQLGLVGKFRGLGVRVTETGVLLCGHELLQGFLHMGELRTSVGGRERVAVKASGHGTAIGRAG